MIERPKRFLCPLLTRKNKPGGRVFRENKFLELIYCCVLLAPSGTVRKIGFFFIDEVHPSNG